MVAACACAGALWEVPVRSVLEDDAKGLCELGGWGGWLFAGSVELRWFCSPSRVGVGAVASRRFWVMLVNTRCPGCGLWPDGEIEWGGWVVEWCCKWAYVGGEAVWVRRG